MFADVAEQVDGALVSLQRIFDSPEAFETGSAVGDRLGLAAGIAGSREHGFGAFDGGQGARPVVLRHLHDAQVVAHLGGVGGSAGRFESQRCLIERAGRVGESVRLEVVEAGFLESFCVHRVLVCNVQQGRRDLAEFRGRQVTEFFG